MVCLNLTEQDNATFGGEKAQALYEEVSYVIYGFLLPAVCAFGIVGNLLNLTILTRRKLQKSFRTLEQAANLCLISLAVSDLMFCVFAFPSMFLPKNDIYATKGGSVGGWLGGWAGACVSTCMVGVVVWWAWWSALRGCVEMWGSGRVDVWGWQCGCVGVAVWESGRVAGGSVAVGECGCVGVGVCVGV